MGLVMFEKLFATYQAISRHRNSPLIKERLQYLNYLSKQQMSKRVLKEVAIYLLIVIEFLHLNKRKKKLISIGEIHKAANNWANREPKPKNLKDIASSKRKFIKHAKRWLQFIGKLSVPAKKHQPYDVYLEKYKSHMENDLEYSQKTIEVNYRIILDFLRRHYKSRHSLKNITISHIDEILTRKLIEDNYALTTIQSYASALRGFFRFAEKYSWCISGLSEMIEAPRVYKHSYIPSGPTWNDIQKLIASTEGHHPANVRDRAILLLFTVYGLRSGEVVSLKLDDFNWEDGLIYVYRPKSRKTQLFPLVRSVGDSILCYLKHVRPISTHRNLFLCMRAPFLPVDNSTIYTMVSRRLHMLGILSDKYGPHSLRHACATRLLEQEFTLKEIGDLLGHIDPEATRIYAKVDIKGLRTVGDFNIGKVL
jgi:integrase/recombinase XerD